MLRHSFSSLILLGLTSLASGSVLYARGEDIAVGGKWKAHDQVTAFQQQAADGLEGELEIRFKPGLNDGSGCFPYAAVDKDGYHGAGLRPTGKSGGDCRDANKGQIYARVGTSNGRTGIFYSWYLPKIQNAEKHKHYYLNTVVWVHSDKCDPVADDYRVVGVSYSTGKETFDTSVNGQTLYSSGDSGSGPGNTHAIVGYDGQMNVFPSTDGAQYALNPPMISWKKLSQPAVEQLNGIQYEHARNPFNDNNIQASLDAAFNANFYTNLVAEADNCNPNTATPTTPASQPEDPAPSSPPEATPSTPTPTEPASDPTTTDAPTPSTTYAGDDLIEDGPEIVPSSLPADPTYTPTP
ncbi:npp1 domain-containing protein [Colletotrichum camelliae]|nr:npp1 domain-containing protein [Colletotrichum camelliae]